MVGERSPENAWDDFSCDGEIEGRSFVLQPAIERMLRVQAAEVVLEDSRIPNVETVAKLEEHGFGGLKSLAEHARRRVGWSAKDKHLARRPSEEKARKVTAQPACPNSRTFLAALACPLSSAPAG